MKPITNNSEPDENVFYILVAEKKNIFINQLHFILNSYKPFFQEITFKIIGINDVHKFNHHSLKHIQLIFLEDEFLLEIPKDQILKLDKNIDVVLLMYDSFNSQTLLEIKRFIDKNSLNLCGHISLTNYTFNLIKLLVADFIKAKLQVYDSEET